MSIIKYFAWKKDEKQLTILITNNTMILQKYIISFTSIASNAVTSKTDVTKSGEEYTVIIESVNPPILKVESSWRF
jgi:hypothetical protein